MASWEEIKEHLEPIGDRFYTTPYDDIQLSIAISIKRIADSMEKAGKPAMMTGISEEEYQKWYESHPGSAASPYIVNKP